MASEAWAKPLYMQLLVSKRTNTFVPEKLPVALARRTGLPLKTFKCAWFDANDYFEFFPLTAVYNPRIRAIGLN